MNFNITLFFLHSPEEEKFLHFDFKRIAYVYIAGVQNDADTQTYYLLHYAVLYLNYHMK